MFLLKLGINNRFLVVILTLIALGYASLGMPKLTFDTSLTNLFNKDTPGKAIYDEVTETFGSDNITIIYIRDRDLFTENKLDKVQGLHYKLQNLENVVKVESLFSLKTLQSSEDGLYSGPLLYDIPEDQKKLDEVIYNAQQNPLAWKNMISEDGKSTSIIVYAESFLGQTNQEEKLYNEINQSLKKIEQDFQEVYQLGSARLRHQLTESIINDMKTLAPLAMIIFVLIVSAYVRNFFGAVIPIISSVVSVYLTLGLMGHLGITVNILTAMVPALIVVLGSTEDIHLYSGYLNAAGELKNIDDRKMITDIMVHHVGAAVLLAIITTLLGFCSNIFSSIDIIRTFAYASTLGIGINGGVTLLLVPLILTFLGPQNVAETHKHKLVINTALNLNKLTALVEHIVLNKSNIAIYWTIGFIVVMIAFTTQVKFSNDPISFFKKNSPVVQEVESNNRYMAGIQTFNILLKSSNWQYFKNPENLAKTHDVIEYLKNTNKFDTVTSLVDLLSYMNRAVHDDDPLYFHPPKDKDTVQQYLSLFTKSDLEPYVNSDFRQLNINVRHHINNSHELNPVIADVKAQIQKILGPEVKVELTGLNLLINQVTDDLMYSQLISFGFVLLVIFVIMTFLFSNLKAGLVSLLPNMIPIISVFGVMGIFDIPLNMATVLVVVITIGIAVDDTIHLFTKYNHYCQEYNSNDKAIQVTLRYEILPILTTSTALTGGFLALMGSDFRLIVDFGILSAVAITVATITDLIVSPILLSKFRLVGIWDMLEVQLENDLLETSKLFKEMNSDEIKKTILLSKNENFKTGEVLIKQNESVPTIYLILSGKVEIVREVADREIRRAIFGAGETVGVIEFFTESKCATTIRALEDVEVMVFDYDSMMTHTRYYPVISNKLSRNLVAILSQRLKALYLEREGY